MSEKYICIHGHFYQPPRENPWLEAVEEQPSAFPYHDWNERITTECYAPNAFARLLNGGGIRRLVSNYSKMSFNFGPTLLAWMRDKAPEIHQAVLDADQASRKSFAGHGSAIAQCYNHIIMPLANQRDKATQVEWGLRDFEFRFGRKPEGMWLPETAADDESLEVLAARGIKFTILSPFQASRVRPLGGKKWEDVNGGKVNPLTPYLVKLGSGRSIAVFFYEANVAKSVAFEGLLASGEQFARRLTSAFDPGGSEPQLMNMATDGESYGHHFHSGDMALAYALGMIERGEEARLTVYGEYLEKQPPTREAQIHQGSAWSCPHGVDRWRKNCGCNSGGRPEWNQKWREPLRNAMDWLRDRLAEAYEAKARELLKDPWAARNDYINVILDRSPENTGHFFARHSARALGENERTDALCLLEIQRHALLMYTSCGWFFDDLSGIETVQVIQYAARAIQLARKFGQDLQEGFLRILEKAESNLPDPHTGRQIYERYVLPAVMTREGAAAHYAISSLFETYEPEARIYSFRVKQEDRQNWTAGKSRLATGRIEITSEITRNSDRLTYVVFHTGDHTINCAVRESPGPEEYGKLVEAVRAPFDRGDFPDLIREMDRYFGPKHYSVERLFHDEQRKILEQILAVPGDEVYNTLRLITDRYAPLMRFLSNLRTPPLKSLSMATETVLNTGLLREFAKESLDRERVRALLAECAATKTALYKEELAYALKTHLDRVSEQFRGASHDLDCLRRFAAAAELAREAPFAVNLWKPQNIYFGLAGTALPEMRAKASLGDHEAKAWVDTFLVLGEKLGFETAALVN